MRAAHLRKDWFAASGFAMMTEDESDRVVRLKEGVQ